MKKLLVILMLLSPKFVNGQTDTLFYFAAPEVTENDPSNAGLDRPIVFRITSYSQPATVTISQPANSFFPVQVFTIPADSLYTFDLTQWIGSIENKPANTTLNYGLKIQSTSRITVYYEVVSLQCLCDPEIFVLKGQTALGFDFWIPSQNILNNFPNTNPITNSSFDIVATQNNTSVTITPSHNIIGHTANSTFTIILNEGQTYSAMAASRLASKHLNGSRVVSNKAIAVTIKDDYMEGASIFGGCADLGGDQIVPVPILGTEYIAINGFLDNIGDQIFVLATQDTTIISQNGNVVDTINAGDTKQLDVGDSSSYIQTTYPVYILQISGYGCEVGIDILPQIICTGSYNIALARSSSEAFFINLLVPNGGQNGFFVNGISGIISDTIFKQVPGTNGQWLSGQKSLDLAQLPVGGSVLIRNDSLPFHLSVIHGGIISGTRFGYFSDFDCTPANGINEINPITELLIYPNPATTELNFKFSSGIKNATIEIFNLMGEKLISGNSFNGSFASFDISNLSKGVYFVKVSNKEKSAMQKFIKQ